MEKKFNVNGMSCAACKMHVDKAVRKVSGVNDVNVNLLTNSMTVDCANDCNINEINKAVKNAGYSSKEVNIDEIDLKDKTTKKMFIRLIVSLILVVPLFTLSYISKTTANESNIILFGYIDLVLALVIMFVNAHFYINGFKSIIHRSLNMDSLVAFASSIAFVYSLVILILMTKAFAGNNLDYVNTFTSNLSFETAGMIPSFIGIGKTLESFSKGKTTNALSSLLKLAPEKAFVIREGKTVEINAKDILITDTFIVKSGEKVPADGIIIEGKSSLDESMLTGESVYVDKTVDDNVLEGTMNQLGTIKCKVLHVGKDTTLNKIVQMVNEANSTKAKISKLADKISSIFIPVVMIIALAVFILWLIFGKYFESVYSGQTLLTYSVTRAIAVLVVSCPCALGLATPVAIMVSSGRGAKNGILFKTSQIMEETGKADFIVLDKTGTITYGKPTISNVKAYNGYSEDDLLLYARSIESLSSHPLASAIVDKNTLKLKEVKNFKTLISYGVKGEIDSKEMLAVNLKYLKENNLLSNKDMKLIENINNSATNMYFIYDNKLIGVISVKDKIKEDTVEAINKIKDLGIIPVMLTGDNKYVAKEIADEANIDYYLSEVTPFDKQTVVKYLKTKGKVVMVGDGINDAIALTEANIGMGIKTGTDIALDSSDIVLMKSSLMDAYKAIVLSKKTITNIKENLFWAFIYNIIMIPLAALSMIKPWYGALFMSFSSVIVVTNALRLNIVNIDSFKKVKSYQSLDDEFYNILKEGEKMKKVFNVEGMMCDHCVAHVQKACLKEANVVSAVASLKDNNVVVEYNNELNSENIIKNIEDAGYNAKEN